jgi:two-component system, OmpR family, response regulator MprA
MPPNTILVADDDALLRQLLDTALRGAGYTVALAADGAELVRMAWDAPPALVLTDMAMPLFDGLDAIRLLRADPRTAAVPILAMSARLSLADAALTAGADAFLAKPFTLDDLLTQIAEHLGRCTP